MNRFLPIAENSLKIDQEANQIRALSLESVQEFYKIIEKKTENATKKVTNGYRPKQQTPHHYFRKNTHRMGERKILCFLGRVFA